MVSFHLQGFRKFVTQSIEVDLISIGEKWKHKTLQGIPKAYRHGCNKNIYITSMFPYPSGMLHIGHLRVYTISDTINRYYQLKGYNVLHPMGWDSFGLPAENAALERGISPSIWTENNISKMKEQMSLMLGNFHWDKEVITCHPDYYKFTQMIFLELFKHGLAYKKEAEINWDPVDQTVLANEQVDSQGRSWRSGALVEKKLLNQWFLGITKFANDLDRDLEYLKDWPSNVKTMQKNWIGKSYGTEVIFQSNMGKNIKVFTTRTETLYSVQYLALALNHPIVKELIDDDINLQNFAKYASELSEDSKEGYKLTSLKVCNPLLKNKCFDIPVFVAPYVLGSYGYGAVMGCPAHDERDFAFWKYNIPNKPIKFTIGPQSEEYDSNKPYTLNDGFLLSNTEEFAGLSTTQARKEITNKLEMLGSGKFTTQYRLKDWLISRQRYWGAPIPIIYCNSCGIVPVPMEQLPVTLPQIQGLASKGNPLSEIESFVNVTCPSCDSPAKRETDTMDTFMDSSWYLFRYSDPKNSLIPFSHEKATELMPVDMYIGGIEHAILHLLYTRFISKFLSSIGMWNGSQCHSEPIKKLVTQGMVHGKTFINPQNGHFLKPDELDLSNPEKPFIKVTGDIPKISYEKMSKSKYNGADPRNCIEKHGPDATRAHILFQAPIPDMLGWDESKIVGVKRWLSRVIKLSQIIPNSINCNMCFETPRDLNEKETKFHNEIQSLIQNISNSYEVTLSLNTVISDYMKLTNMIESAFKNKNIQKELVHMNFQKLITLIYPVVPSVSEEAINNITKIHNNDWNPYKWPVIEHIRESNIIKYQIVINGKMRFTHCASKHFTEDPSKLVNVLKSLPEGKKYLNEKEINNLIIKNNVISFVLKK